MNDPDPKSESSGWSAALLAAAVFGLALLAGALVPKGEPPKEPKGATIELLAEAEKPAPFRTLQPERTEPSAPAAREPETAPEAPAEVLNPLRPEGDPNIAPGEVLGGLQLILRAEKIEVRPGEEIAFSWKLVNTTSEPIRYLDCKPALAIQKPGFAGQYIAAGQNLPATADDLRTIQPREALSFQRSIEWPKIRARQPDGWPNYADAGEYRVTVGFATNGSIAQVARQLKSERGLDVYHEPLVSGVLIVTVRGGRIPVPEEDARPEPEPEGVPVEEF